MKPPFTEAFQSIFKSRRYQTRSSERGPPAPIEVKR
jgi:hypothetical protein